MNEEKAERQGTTNPGQSEKHDSTWPLGAGAAGSRKQLDFQDNTGTNRLQPELPGPTPVWLPLYHRLNSTTYCTPN